MGRERQGLGAGGTRGLVEGRLGRLSGRRGCLASANALHVPCVKMIYLALHQYLCEGRQRLPCHLPGGEGGVWGKWPSSLSTPLAPPGPSFWAGAITGPKWQQFFPGLSPLQPIIQAVCQRHPARLARTPSAWGFASY